MLFLGYAATQAIGSELDLLSLKVSKKTTVISGRSAKEMVRIESTNRDSHLAPESDPYDVFLLWDFRVVEI